MKQLFTFILILIALSGCAGNSFYSATWPQRVQRLNQLTTWNLTAQVGVQTPQETGSVTLRWQQQKESYTINLFGPLGSHAVQLVGTPGQVTLQASQGEPRAAATPERLLWQETGWDLPISQLYYWVRGLPAPGFKARTQFDNAHRLSVLEQEGWSIHFLSYQVKDAVEVPGKIFLEHGELKIKIVIKQWQ